MNAKESLHSFCAGATPILLVAVIICSFTTNTTFTRIFSIALAFCYITCFAVHYEIKETDND